MFEFWRDGKVWPLAFLALMVAWLPSAGNGHDDIWIYIHSAETLLDTGAFQNVNGARQLVVTSWLLTLLGLPVVWLAPDDGLWIWLAWKIYAFLPYALGLALLLHHISRRAGSTAAVAVVLLLWAFPSVSAWAWGGLDSGIFLLGAVAFSRCIGRLADVPGGRFTWFQACAAGIVFCFSRTDASWGFLLPFLVATWPGNSHLRPGLLRLGLILMAMVAVSVAVTFWWTGQPLPNPALVKAGFGWLALLDGIDYWMQWFAQSPAHLSTIALWPVCIWVVARRMLGRSCDNVTACLASIALLMDWASVVTGADWMSHFRFATRTLEIKLAVTVLAFPGLVATARFSRARSAAWLGLMIAAILSSGSASGVVRGYRGLTALPPGNPANWSRLFLEGESALISWNDTNSRDFQGIGGFFDSVSWRSRRDTAWKEGRPIVFASYQAGYFARLLRRKGGEATLFIDLAGLTDYRLAVPREQPRTALGLSAGIIDWADSFRNRLGPVAAAQRCVPELVYVLGADIVQRRLMRSAGYHIEWETQGAVVFALDAGQPVASRVDCAGFRV